MNAQIAIYIMVFAAFCLFASLCVSAWTLWQYRQMNNERQERKRDQIS